MDALLIIDVQNDFCPGGALAVADGDAVAEPINHLAKQFPLVIATRDWHPPDHSSFYTRGGPWPVHCVQGSPGAELRPDLDTGAIDLVLDKGQTADRDGYSAFEDTGLEQLLRQRGIGSVHVTGLALDVCVKASALDAARAGFDVTVHLQATRPVEAHPGDGEAAVRELLAAGVKVVD